MKIEITIDGETYISKDSDEATASEFAETLFQNMGCLNRYKMELENGMWLVLGKDAVQRAQVVIMD